MLPYYRRMRAAHGFDEANQSGQLNQVRLNVSARIIAQGPVAEVQGLGPWEQLQSPAQHQQVRRLKLLPRPKTLNLRHRTLSYDPRRSLASTCSVGPTDSRRPSHALLAYDGNMVAYAKLRIFA